MSLYMARCIWFWATHSKREMEKQESAQRRTSKMVRGLKHMRYWERLKKRLWFSIQKWSNYSLQLP